MKKEIETEGKTGGKGGKRRDEVANPFYPTSHPLPAQLSPVKYYSVL